jgi:hypothetical protein
MVGDKFGMWASLLGAEGALLPFLGHFCCHHLALR